MKKEILKWLECYRFLMMFLALCLCVIPVCKVGAYSQYRIENGTYDTQITLKQGEQCGLNGYGSYVSEYEYYSMDETVAWVDGDGEVTANAIGSTYINILGYDEYGQMSFYAEVIIYVVEGYGDSDNENDDQDTGNDADSGDEEVAPVDMAGVTLTKDSVKIKAERSGYSGYYWYYGTSSIKLKDTPEPISSWMDTVDFNYESSNGEMEVYCSLQDSVITIAVYNIGTTQLKITINDRIFTCTIKAVPIYINKSSLLITKGETKQLKVKNGGSAVKWKSLDKSVATVSSSGVVEGKKIGTAVILATVGDRIYGCAVNVTTVTMKGVANRALSIAKGVYDQNRRMQKGYYDCSSLVWRAYAPAGIKFGNNNWAPVAADIAKWSMSHGKKVCNVLNDKQIAKRKLEVGDLLFQTGTDNGRYKGIYHVEMFIGYDYYGMDDGGEPILTTSCPARSSGYGYGTLVIRPRK